MAIFTYFFFFFNDPATTEIYTLSLHDALPISPVPAPATAVGTAALQLRRPGPRCSAFGSQAAADHRRLGPAEPDPGTATRRPPFPSRSKVSSATATTTSSSSAAPSSPSTCSPPGLISPAGTLTRRPRCSTCSRATTSEPGRAITPAGTTAAPVRGGAPSTRFSLTASCAATPKPSPHG